MSVLPNELRGQIEAAWGEAVGVEVRLASSARLGGGCISPAARLETEGGEIAFAKWGSGGTPPALFAAEAFSLGRLRAAAAVRVPAVIAVGEQPPGWLLLEWLPPAPPTNSTWERLGRGLAALHRVGSDRWGWPQDNFIGALPQANAWAGDWPGFWRERRLEPQLRHAYARGYFDAEERRRFERLLNALPDLLGVAARDGPSLLHGDLWGGNVHVTRGGEAALIDPAAYHGHREADLAMARLFGGFDRPFWDTYCEAWPLEPGYEPRRRAAYQMYYLLVHVNLFGGGYAGQTLSALAEAGF